MAATEAQLQAALNDPNSDAPGDKVYNRNWDQLCQAYVYQLCRLFGSAPVVYSSADLAREASGWLNPDASAAPPGAIHYWKQNHVAIGLGGERVTMGSYHVTEKWVPNGTAGVTTVSAYTRATGLTYAGWSPTNGANVIYIAGGGIDYAWGLTTAAQLAVQKALTKLGYYKLDVDGEFGEGSVRSFQQWLKDNGYLADDYKVDGEPGPIYGRAVQTLATEYGYDWEIDGYPAENTSAAIERWAASVLAETPPLTGILGIDVATSQAQLDFTAAKAAGVEFAIVKAGGRNVLPEYVSPYYADEVASATAAGMYVGHYYLPGRGKSPAEQAEFFASIVVNFDDDHGVLALDNEMLDDNGTYWRDAEVAEFVTRLHEITGVPYSRIWVYFPAHLTRVNAPWPLTQALQVKRWWAAYGDNTSAWKPDHEPDLQGSLSDWDIHQFSSSTKIGTVTVDANYSRMSVEELFAKGEVVPPEPEPEPEVPEPEKPEPKPEPGKGNGGIIASIIALVTAIGAAIASFFLH